MRRRPSPCASELHTAGSEAPEWRISFGRPALALGSLLRLLSGLCPPNPPIRLAAMMAGWPCSIAGCGRKDFGASQGPHSQLPTGLGTYAGHHAQAWPHGPTPTFRGISYAFPRVLAAGPDFACSGPRTPGASRKRAS